MDVWHCLICFSARIEGLESMTDEDKMVLFVAVEITNFQHGF